MLFRSKIMKKVLSFSLFGNDEIYSIGSIENDKKGIKFFLKTIFLFLEKFGFNKKHTIGVHEFYININSKFYKSFTI